MKKLFTFLVLLSSSAYTMERFSPMITEASCKTSSMCAEASRACGDRIIDELVRKVQDKLFSLILEEDYYHVRDLIKKSKMNLVNMQWPKHLQIEVAPDEFEENPLLLAVDTYNEVQDKRNSLKIVKYLLRQRPRMEILTRAQERILKWKGITPKDPCLIAVNRTILKEKMRPQL